MLKNITIIIVLIMIGTIIIFTGCSSNKSAAIPPQKETQQRRPNNYGEIHAELADSFNKVFSQGSFEQLYAGMKHDEKSDTLVIAVNDTWNYASKDVKEAMIKNAGTVWAGMCGARGIKFDSYDFKIIAIHAASKRKVATWDYVWGFSLKD